MTYEETLQYLFAQLPMFSRVGAAAYKKDIHNTVALCNALGNPQNKFKSVHIAGTNGKGSTSHMLAAIFQQQGYKTGLYTSPHLRDFGERIRINGQMIDQQFVIDFTEKTKKICSTLQPSFFELTVAMAFDYFAKEQVDIAIIETGLGGRLDSTNIISPLLSVITNIGMDHTNLLGNTIEAIAYEKAGIIKSQTPIVIGETTTATKKIFTETAASNKSDIYFSEDMFTCAWEASSNKGMSCLIRDLTNDDQFTVLSDLKGNYQLNNIRTVFAAVAVLKKLGFNFDSQVLHQAFSSVQKITGFAGRWQIIATAPTIILDVAHNKEGIQWVVEQLLHEYQPSQIHFVLGFVNDKAIDPILNLLPKQSHYYFTNAHIPRALANHELMQKAHSYELIGESYHDVNEAIANAKKNANHDEVIMVCGSFFILSEIK